MNSVLVSFGLQGREERQRANSGRERARRPVEAERSSRVADGRQSPAKANHSAQAVPTHPSRATWIAASEAPPGPVRRCNSGVSPSAAESLTSAARVHNARTNSTCRPRRPTRRRQAPHGDQRRGSSFPSRPQQLRLAVRSSSNHPVSCSSVAIFYYSLYQCSSLSSRTL
jgi:hypothetical protein